MDSRADFDAASVTNGTTNGGWQQIYAPTMGWRKRLEDTGDFRKFNAADHC